MNYITEINCFYDWLETNSVSDSSIVLWHALMHINNKCGWKVEFPVAISSIQNKTGLSKSSILRARNQLKQVGRITFKERTGNLSTVYRIVAFHTDTQSGTQSGTQTVTQSGTQTDTIHKLNETKLKETIKKEAVATTPPSKIQKFSIEKYMLPENLPFTGEEFIAAWKKLLETKKWRNKEESAIELALKKMKKYNEEFMTQQIESASVGGWQGLFFSNTDDDFKKFIQKSNKTEFEKKSESISNTATLAMQLITAKQSEI
jgi:hypothetical protein